MDVNNKILSWIKQTFHKVISVENTQEIGRGFMAEMVFVKIKIIDLDNTEKELYLAVKRGKDDQEIREKWPLLVACYQREIFLYNKIISTFYDLQKQKNLQEIFDFAPKCYNTILSDTEEVIILENLTMKGYNKHPATKTLNLNHLKLVFKKLAKFHALSFGLKNTNKDSFNNLILNLKSPVLIGSAETKIESYKERVKKILKQLEKFKRNDLAKKFEKLTENGVLNIFDKILNDSPKENVIIHGDSHNNNLLFKYKDKTFDTPIDVMLIDFQLSHQHSPVLDLSYFWYFCSSKKEHPHFQELIITYYQELGAFLSQLGGNINEYFSLETLWNHWKKYALFSLLTATLYMDLLYHDDNSLQDVIVRKETNDLDNQCIERICDVLDHYFNFSCP